MSKPKTPPLLGLPNSEARRERQARLAIDFSFNMSRLCHAALSVGRAERFTATRKDAAAALLRTRREARARLVERTEDAGIRRRFLAEQRELDRSIASFWRRFRCKIRREVKPSRASRTKSSEIGSSPRGGRPASGSMLTSYTGPVIDRFGRRGVYMDVKYHGARRSRVGIAGGNVKYITRADGVEYDEAGNASVISNVGEYRAEQVAAFDLVETLNRAARGNAKIIITMIVNLPHDIEAAERLEILRRFCDEAFHAHDLPYVAAVHEPSAEGDQRNKHGHIVFSLRPLRRIDDHEWDAGQAVLTEFDTPERFTHYRKLFAEMMTEVVQEAGKQRTYTHLSNVDRGLKAQPLEKLGQAKTAAMRRGERVAAAERNKARIASNERLVAEDRSSRRLAGLAARIDDLRDLRAKIASLSAIVAFWGRVTDQGSAGLAVVATPIGNIEDERAKMITASSIVSANPLPRAAIAPPTNAVPIDRFVRAEAPNRSDLPSAITSSTLKTGVEMDTSAARSIADVGYRRFPPIDVPVYSIYPYLTPVRAFERVMASALNRQPKPVPVPLDSLMDLAAIVARMARRSKLTDARRLRGGRTNRFGLGTDDGNGIG